MSVGSNQDVLTTHNRSFFFLSGPVLDCHPRYFVIFGHIPKIHYHLELSTLAPLLHRVALTIPFHSCLSFTKGFYPRASKAIQASAPRIAIHTALGRTTELLGTAGGLYKTRTFETLHSPFFLLA
jgi:hypothetical protein